MLATADAGPAARSPAGGGQNGQMPDVTDKECDAVKAAFAKHPDAETKLAGLRTRVQSGELDFQQMRTESQKIYETVGVDSRVAGACRMRERQRAGGDSGPRSGRQAAGSEPARWWWRRPGSIGHPVPSAAPASSTPVQAGEFTSRRARPSLVFVAENGSYRRGSFGSASATSTTPKS